MSIWSSLLRAGGRAVKSGGRAVVHPQRALTGAGHAVKTAATGAAVGYVAWEKLTTDKSVTRIVSEAVIGEEATNKVATGAEHVIDEAKELKQKATQTMDSVSSVLGNSDTGFFGGIGNFFSNLFGGNAGDMFGNLFNNIAKGNVSGLSIAGLIAAGFMIFGRFGWLGKIAGALLAIFLIGNNSRNNLNSSVSETGSQTGRTRGQASVAEQETEQPAERHGARR